ncbi:hypothetical protein F7R20_19745 [Pseudomonas brassicacearum subsp. brassicacearum]|nr:hypothetical protein AK973_4628 [Pseudomonas brassicacearum]EIK66023.1 hypothetical protein PflQ8_4256 [Pseudomonas fluorescens Q8r1-96]KAB0524296.1 hypothetical protein F7R20_19745 [Pseudomonas brassicacearum subsp. brassicacearum]PJH88734.1 hypothetical protein CVG87_13775 [Pseudomonas sp. WCS365]QEO81968.1 hypothetical protein ELZ14_23050 [Pseudomonas brassicacearum]
MMDHGLASRRWSDCIQLYVRFVSLIFCIFHRSPRFVYTARNLPIWSINGWKNGVSVGLA